MRNNRDTSPEAAIGMMIFGALAMAALFLFFVAAVISFVFTLVCIWAWNEERPFFGETITPQEARSFIAWGVAGAVLAGAFGLILNANDLGSDSAPWLAIGGYTFGSLGWAAWYSQQQERQKQEAAQQAMLSAMQRPAQPPRQEPRISEPLQDFEYASWDDEEPRA
jgi:hypothetical protein